MFPQQGAGSPWRRFRRRILIVGATWTVLALVAMFISPDVALTAGAVPLAVAAYGAWQAKVSGKWQQEDHIMRRQVTATALVLAGGMFFATAWSLRDRVPPWAPWMELCVLLHYWLLTLG